MPAVIGNGPSLAPIQTERRRGTELLIIHNPTLSFQLGPDILQEVRSDVKRCEVCCVQLSHALCVQILETNHTHGDAWRLSGCERRFPNSLKLVQSDYTVRHPLIEEHTVPLSPWQWLPHL